MPTYSFYSITEVSEYVPDVEEYGRILRDREGVDPESTVYKTKVAAYAERLEPMNQQRLYPEFPDWPCLCFYPMSKMRAGRPELVPAARSRSASELMSQHGRSGMKFAGRVAPAHHGVDGSRRLGVGRHPLGPQPGLPEGHRLHHAVRRELGPVRPVRPHSTSATFCLRPSCWTRSGSEGPGSGVPSGRRPWHALGGGLVLRKTQQREDRERRGRSSGSSTVSFLVGVGLWFFST